MEIFKLFGSIFVDSSKAEQSISKTDKKAGGLAKTFGKGIKVAGKWALGVGAGAAAVGTAMYGMASKAADATDRIDKLSQRLGLSREGFQEWEYVLSQSGVSIDSMQSGMKSLTQRMGDAIKGTGKGADAFKELGVTITENMSQEDAFNLTIKALQDMEDGTRKAALAQDLFSRSGQELLPLLNGTAESTDALKQKARDLGLVLSNESIDAGVKFTDTVDSLKRVFGGLFTQLGASVMPMFITFGEWITSNMPQIKESVSTAFKTIGNVIDFLKDNIFMPFVDYYRDNLEDIKGVSSQVFEVIGKAIHVFKDIVLDIKDTVMEWIEDNKDRLNELKDKFGESFYKIAKLVKVVLGIIQDLWEKYGDNIMAFIGGMMTVITDIISNALDIIMGIVQIFIDIFTGNWSALGEDITNLIHTLWDNILEYFGHVIDMILKLFGTDLETVVTQVTDIFNNIKDTVKGIVDSVVDTVKGMIDWIGRAIDKINIFKRKKKEAEDDDDGGNNTPDVDGSHANGLDYVPYNGYVAELHKGERVLTAQENKDYSKGKGEFKQIINFYGKNNPSPREAARKLANVNRKMAIEWGQ